MAAQRAAVAVLLLLAVVGAAHGAADNSGDTVSNVDGSGSTIAAPFVLKMMEVVKSWTTPLIGLTYRSVGSAAGHAEFIHNETAPENDFNVAEYALPNALRLAAEETGNQAVHIPFAISQLGFYHSIPGIAGQGALTLSCEVLARIFSGKILNWNDEAIRNLNPDVAWALPSTPIIVVKRGLGCGSTYGITNYFSKVCPGAWLPLLDPLGPVIGPVVSAWDGRLSNYINVASSHDMGQVLSVTPNAIGYVDAGHARTMGLKEVSINNPEGAFMHSAQANTAVLGQFLNEGTPAITPTDDWSSYNLIAMPGARTWPINLVSFYMTRHNLTWLESEGSLLQLFVQTMLSDEGTEFLTELGYIPLVPNLRRNLTSYVKNLEIAANAQAFKFEEEIDVVDGSDDWMVSPNRQNYLYQNVFEMERSVGKLKQNARLGHAYQVHGSGSFAPASALRQIMQQLTEQSREPIQATYRSVGSVTAEAEFLDYTTNFNQYNHFKVGDAPLQTDYYRALQPPNGPGVVQIPFAAAAIGIYYNQQLPGFPTLDLDACKLALIMNNTYFNWQDVPGLGRNQLLDKRIVLYSYSGGHTIMRTVETYLRRACPFFRGLSTDCPKCEQQFERTLPSGEIVVVNITSPALMVEALSQRHNSMGFLPSNFATGTGLFAARLPVTSTSNYMTPSAEGAFNAASVITGQLPSGWTGDWSAVDAVDKRSVSPPAWPITQIMFFWVYRNLTAYQYSGPLTKALIRYTVSTNLTEGQSMIEAQGLAKLPPSWKLLADRAIDTLYLDPLLEDWRVEAWSQVSATGQGLLTFSSNRESALAAQVRNLTSQVNALMAQLSASLPVNVRVVSNSDAAVVVRQGLTMLEKAANQPIKASLEFEADQRAAVGWLMAPARAHIAILDQPLSHAQHSNFHVYDQQAMQVPIFIRSVSLLVNGAPNGPSLFFSACKVAYLLRGDARNWRDPRLATGWDSSIVSQLPAGDFVVITASRSSGDYQAMKRYAALACPEVVVNDDSSVQEMGSGRTEDVLSNLAARPDYTTIGIASRFLVDAMALSTSAGIQEIALQSRQGPPLRSSVLSDASPNYASYTDSYTSLLDTALGGGLSGTPAMGAGSALLRNWTEWNNALVFAGVQAATYPVVRADFIVLPADLAPLGTGGGAVAGAAAFLTSPAFQDRSSPTFFLYPGLGALGPVARRFAQEQLAPSAFNLAPGARAWAVTNASALVASSESDVEAPAIMTNSWTDEGQVLSPSMAYIVAMQATSSLAMTYRQEVVDVRKQADLAYSIAVAAIVIGTIVSLLALGLAVYAVRSMRSSARAYETQRVMQSGGGGGGSVTGTASLINGLHHVSSGPVPELLMTQTSSGRK